MDFFAWIAAFVLAANGLIAQGYQYDLSTGQFVNGAGQRVEITCCVAPKRG